MKLSELICQENNVSQSEVMFLRHGSRTIKQLLTYKATVLEINAIQPINTKYDFAHSDKTSISIVVVIIDDKVNNVYKVGGVEAEGTNFTLGSNAYTRFNQAIKAISKPSRRFLLKEISSASIDLPINGWAGRARTTVQRSDDGFFDEIMIESSVSIIAASFVNRVQIAQKDSSEARRKRLANAPIHPPRVEITSTSVVYSRNPDVVAEALYLAKGICQMCYEPAPFISKSTGEPYLEVHHIDHLAKGGEDTIGNAIAICPNCHRQAHYGS